MREPPFFGFLNENGEQLTCLVNYKYPKGLRQSRIIIVRIIRGKFIYAKKACKNLNNLDNLPVNQISVDY